MAVRLAEASRKVVDCSRGAGPASSRDGAHRRQSCHTAYPSLTVLAAAHAPKRPSALCRWTFLALPIRSETGWHSAFAPSPLTTESNGGNGKE